MSKAAKQSIFILIGLLAASLGFAGLTFMAKQKVEQQKLILEKNLQESQEQVKSSLVEVQKLKEQVGKEQEEKSKSKKTVADMEKRIEDMVVQISEITSDRDKWKQRLDNIKKERDELLVKLKEKPEPQIIYQEKIVYKEKEPEPAPPVEAPKPQAPEAAEPKTPPAIADETREDVPESLQDAQEEHWAQLLKEKAALELEMDKLKKELSEHSIEIVELKQANEALQIELDTVKHEKEEMEEDIQHNEALVNNLSVELARTKNDRKFVADKVAKLEQQNTELRQQIKKLSSAKTAVEKSIVRLVQDKDGVQKKLEQTETLVQSKIDEIWEIKDSLDRSFQAAKSTPTAGEVELPPIVVSAGGSSKLSGSFSLEGTRPGFEGKIVSINEGNNFVIIDVGEKRGIHPGDILGVYRGSEYIARLEVIQARQDISAADLKDQWAKVKVGDIVR
ncbi:MAG: hypothetical protein A3D87_04695 [Omnitrophica WOR_2 bacterium RIFCSPHIGHO2_02_FULL_50_17]|nr:MAG: hypothetical protein A3D87_04695 [Omnitrophica WOR_2 bacterium RIFCSPHIGHO2_02_FULL_50_17]